MVMSDDSMMKIQTDMAEMKGMLSVVIQNHSSRLDSIDLRTDSLREAQAGMATKLGEQLVVISNVDKEFINIRNEIDKNRTESRVAHDKDVTELESEIAETKQGQSGQVLKALSIITPIGLVITFILSISDRLYGN